MTFKNNCPVIPKKWGKRDFSYCFQFKKLNDNFEKLWRMKSSARVSLKEWLLTISYDQEKADIIASACSELIENCIKYSKNDSYSLVNIYVKKRNIYIETINYTDRTQIIDLKKSLKLIQIYKDDLTPLYIENLRKVKDSASSRLGLIKIIMETQGKISLIKSWNRNIIHLLLKIEQ